jgi:F-type H+-transporting ATPase subunit b
VVLASVKASEGVGWPAALPLLPHPAEIIIGLIAFAILYWIFSKRSCPQDGGDVRRACRSHRGRHAAGRAGPGRGQAALEKYNAQLAEARTEANEIREDAREQGASIVAEMRAQAQAEAARISESAKRQVEAERQQAVVQLRQEVGTLSTTLASKIVGESLEDEVRQKGIVDRFLAELEAGDIKPEKVAPAGQDA